MDNEDAKKLMQYAIDKANSLTGTGSLESFHAWCDTIDCLGEALTITHGITLNVQIVDNEYTLGETK